MPRLTPMMIYKYLPGKNCEACGEESCMALALKLIQREKTPESCGTMTDMERLVLVDILTPPIKEVTIGSGASTITIGGEEVLYRHELKYFNPTAIAIDIADTMDEKTIKERIAFVNTFSIERLGTILNLDMVAIRCASGDPAKFKTAIELALKETDKPLMLCTVDPKVMEEGLKLLKGKNPVMYTATAKNFDAFVSLAKTYDATLVLYSKSPSKLGTFVRKAEAAGLERLVLDPATGITGKALGNSLNRMVKERRAAIENGVKELGYPTITIPSAVGLTEEDPVQASFMETLIASTHMDRFADMIVLSSVEPWSILPLLTLRQNIYTDPRTEPTVKAELYKIGDPDEHSPVILTVNFSLTYFTVEGDLRRSGVSAWLIVLDTNGFAVDTAVAANTMSADDVKKFIDDFKVEEKVKHRKMLIPALAAQLRGDLEDTTGWEIFVAGRDSSEIAGFLKDKWEWRDSVWKG